MYTYVVAVGKYIQDYFEQWRKFLYFGRVLMHKDQQELQRSINAEQFLNYCCR